MKSVYLLFALCTLSIVASPAAQRPDITGTVLTVADKPLSNATVFVYTAGPKVGLGTL